MSDAEIETTIKIGSHTTTLGLHLSQLAILDGRGEQAEAAFNRHVKQLRHELEMLELLEEKA